MNEHTSPNQKEAVRSSLLHSDSDRSTIIRTYTDHGFFGGEIQDDNPEVIEPLYLWVDPEHRGDGIGEDLVKKLIDEAKKLNVNSIRGHIESQYALDIRARLFGKETMKFFDDEKPNDSEIADSLHKELPITFDQARSSLVRAEQYEKDLDARTIGFIVQQDINNNHSA